MGVKKGHILLILLSLNPYISNPYILDQILRLPSHIIGVVHSDYILIILVCGDCPLTLNIGGSWDLLESTPERIPLIALSHKWNQIIFPISDSKLVIWICSQPRVDVNS